MIYVRPAICGFLLVAVVLLRPAGAASQSPSVALSSEDSLRELRAARRAQAGFESFRRARFPWAWNSGGVRCDERVGRFCLQHDDPEAPEWKPKPEPPEVGARRERLLGQLASAAAALPGDGWIAGQRVRYLLEAGDTTGSLRAAEECRAEPVTCAALEGYALHTAADFAAADSAFAVALRAMEPERRREWTDLTELLDPGERRRYRRLGDTEKAALERRFWWLADPLWSVPGNERRSEHYARLVMASLQDRARQPEGLSWGDDLQELLVRYGWPVGWERERPPLHRPGSSPSIISHYAPGSSAFDPSLRMVRDSALDVDEWDLDDERARTEYAPAYARSFSPLRQQTARFRRGDTAVVVVGWAFSHDSLSISAPVEVALVLASPDSDATVVRRSGVAGGGGLAARSTRPPEMVGVEVVAREERRVGRARFTLGPLPPLDPVRRGMSDLLLLRPDATLPDDLEAAVPLARSDTRVATSERTGVFWEVYGVGDREANFELALEPLREGWLARTATGLGLRSPPSAVRLRWRERLPPGAVAPRAVSLDVSDVRPGHYLLRITTVPASGGVLSSELPIEVER